MGNFTSTFLGKIRPTLAVSKQQPTTGLQCLPGLLEPQLVGLIHSHPADPLTIVLDHDMVQIKDDSRLQALLFDLQLIGVVM
ncbi:hypothetical protein WI89_08100 [Burkholderia ubonensis]|nr:hypothetical protein WI89_08100 [Burkholderia ubonensis]